MRQKELEECVSIIEEMVWVNDHIKDVDAVLLYVKMVLLKTRTKKSDKFILYYDITYTSNVIIIILHIITANSKIWSS